MRQSWSFGRGWSRKVRSGIDTVPTSSAPAMAAAQSSACRALRWRNTARRGTSVSTTESPLEAAAFAAGIAAFAPSRVPEVNFIDREVFAKLRALWEYTGYSAQRVGNVIVIVEPRGTRIGVPQNPLPMPKQVWDD